MMTREEVLEIDAYCQGHKMSYRQRLEELDIRFWNYYKAKKKYLPVDPDALQLSMTAGTTLTTTLSRMQSVRAAIAYSLISSCKVVGIDPRTWMEDVLKRLPEYELGNGNLSELLPGNWQQKTATVR